MWVVAAAALVGAGSPALQAQTPPRVIVVGMTSYTFEPGAIRLAQEERVVLQLTNQDQNGRNHILKESLVATTPLVARGDLFADKDKGDVRFIAVAPGKTAEVEVTVPEVATYPAVCSIRGHAQRGMTGTIVVANPPR